MYLGRITTRKPTEWEAYCHYLRQFAKNGGICLGIEPPLFQPYRREPILALDKEPSLDYSESQQEEETK